jgi:hypothetical protein
MHQLLTDSAIWAALLGLASYFVRKLWEDSSINKAIGAEIERLQTVIKRHRDFWQARVHDKTTGHHPLIPFSHVVYDKQVKNVGVINRRLVAQVVRFYGYVDYLNSFQALRGEYEAAGHTDKFNEMYIASLTALVDDFANVF